MQSSITYVCTGLDKREYLMIIWDIFSHFAIQPLCCDPSSELSHRECCDPLSEPSHRDGSDNGSQHMFLTRINKNNP